MRILQVSNYFPEHIGGIETVADNLARAYRRRGHRVVWAAAEIDGAPHHGHADDLPLSAWNVTEARLGFPYPLLAPSAYRRIWAAIRESDVLHIHDCLYQASAFAVLAGRRLGKRVVLTQHVGLVPYRQPILRVLQKLGYQSLGRLVLANADQLTFVSPPVKNWFSRMVAGAAGAPVISNGVDRAWFRPVDAAQRERLRSQLGLPRNGPLLVFSGRFVEKKGLHLLEPVARRRPDWTWVVIGRSGDVDPSSWNLPNVRVRNTLTQDRLAAYYQVADLLTLPSVGEGFPVAVQEAMACGTPALVGEDLMDWLPRALSFATRRNPPAIEAAIAEALRAIGEDGGVREGVADFARQVWDWQRTVASYEALLVPSGIDEQGDSSAAVARS